MIVDCAIYRDGHRVAGAGRPRDHGQAAAAAAARSPGSASTGRRYEEFAEVTREFGLHELAVEDAVTAHQRPKLERYGDTLFCVLRPARYIDETETVEFGEVHVFAGPHFVITVRHGEAPDLAASAQRLEARPDLLRRGPVAILHAILDRVVDDYAPVVAGVENDIDEIEDEVFDGSAGVSRRIYELTARGDRLPARHQAARRRCSSASMADETSARRSARYLRDVQDHALRVQEQVDGFRQLLQNILNVNLTLETKALSEASHRARTRRSRRSPPGPRSCSRPR